MRNILSFLIVFIFFFSNAQVKEKDNFTLQIREEQGDLNDDKLTDKTLILMDTVDVNQPLKLEIHFQKADGNFDLIFSSNKTFNAQYPNGKYGGDQIPYAQIEDGYLILYTEIGNYHYQHKFKFRNGNFELMNFSSVIWGGKDYTVETEFDLQTGLKTEITQMLGSDKILKRTVKKILIRPLPTIQNFKTWEHQWMN